MSYNHDHYTYYVRPFFLRRRVLHKSIYLLNLQVNTKKFFIFFRHRSKFVRIDNVH